MSKRHVNERRTRPRIERPAPPSRVLVTLIASEMLQKNLADLLLEVTELTDGSFRGPVPE